MKVEIVYGKTCSKNFVLNLKNTILNELKFSFKDLENLKNFKICLSFSVICLYVNGS